MLTRLTRFPILALAAAFFLSLVAAAADDPKVPKKEDAKPDAFDKLKLLAGEWVGTGKGSDGKEMKDSKISYKVTSGGTAVVETIDPAGPHEMVTIITRDGNALALTHYCMLGNQPRMKADTALDGNKVAFKFNGGGNLIADKDLHMHGVTYTFIDKDTLKAEWVSCEGGKEGGTMVFELKRKK